MKKKLMFCMFCIIVFVVVFLPITNCCFDSFASLQNSTYSFYTTNFCCSMLNVSIVKNGNSTIVSCSGKDAKQVKKQISNLLGESIKIDNPTLQTQSKIDNYILPFVIDCEIVDDINIYYAYDPSLPNFVIFQNRKVNLQIAKTTSSITIGYPLILGSF